MKESRAILFILAWLQLLRQTLGQNIWSDRANAILPQSNNLKEVGQYEFFMKLQTRISVSPKIVLTFPSDLFPVVLQAGAQCEASLEQFGRSSTLSCV